MDVLLGGLRGDSVSALHRGLWTEGQSPASVNLPTILPALLPVLGRRKHGFCCKVPVNPLLTIWLPSLLSCLVVGWTSEGICFPSCSCVPVEAHLTATFLGFLRLLVH